MAVTFPTQLWRVTGPDVRNNVEKIFAWTNVDTIPAGSYHGVVTRLRQPTKCIVAVRRGYKLPNDLVDTSAPAFTGCPLLTPEGGPQYVCVGIRIEIVLERTIPQAFDWIEEWAYDSEADWVTVSTTTL